MANTDRTFVYPHIDLHEDAKDGLGLQKHLLDNLDALERYFMLHPGAEFPADPMMCLIASGTVHPTSIKADLDTATQQWWYDGSVALSEVSVRAQDQRELLADINAIRIRHGLTPLPE